MNFKSHATAGIVSGIGLTGLAYAMEADLSKNDMILIAPMVFLGSIFSDLDTKSTATKWYATIMFLLLPLFIYSNIPWLWITILVPFIAAQAFKHRSWTHSPWLIIALFFSNFIMAQIAGLTIPKFVPVEFFILKYLPIIMRFQLQIDCFAVGILVHLVLDHKYFKRFGR